MICHNVSNLVFVKPLEDSKKITSVILEALKETGQRGIIDRGWGDLGSSKYFLAPVFTYDVELPTKLLTKLIYATFCIKLLPWLVF